MTAVGQLISPIRANRVETIAGIVSPPPRIPRSVSPWLAAIRIPEAEMKQGLVTGAALYAKLIGLYRRHAASRVLVLSGADPVEASAARVVAAVSEVRDDS